jgi:hypothetical protein
MALSSTAIGTTNTTVYTSSGNNAIACMVVCNVYEFNPSFPTDHTAKLSIWAVANGSSASNTNLIVNALPITAGETLSLDQEKLVLGNGDTLVAKSDTGSTLSITISTLPV